MAQPPAENLVLNSSFESGTTTPTSWSIGSFATKSTVSVQDGSSSLRVSGTGTSTSTSQTIATEVGTTYGISVWINATGMVTGNAVFDTADQYDGIGQGQFVIGAANSGWTKYSGSFTAKSTSVKLRIFTETGFNGTVYFDNIELIAVAVNLPSPWYAQNIGSVGILGNASYANSAYTVSGSGADIFGGSDQFFMVSQKGSGDCTITARVKSMTNSDPWAKASVMIRSALNENSAHASVVVTPSNGVLYQYRTTTGGGSSSVKATTLTAPYWVRVTRVGDAFTGFHSADGVTWTQISSASITMGSGVEIGLAVTSHDNTTTCTAVFDNVTATP
jgi:regulation of enolase protein 1 (concanavalin A-like superfamily)